MIKLGHKNLVEVFFYNNFYVSFCLSPWISLSQFIFLCYDSLRDYSSYQVSEETEALRLPVKQGKVRSDLIKVATRNQTIKQGKILFFFTRHCNK